MERISNQVKLCFRTIIPQRIYNLLIDGTLPVPYVTVCEIETLITK